MEPLQSAWVIGSNLASVPAAIRWYQYGHGVIPLVLLNSGFWSTAYHTCDQTGACLLPYHILHTMDFFWAQFLPLAIVLGLIHWVSPGPWVAFPVGIPFLQTAFFVVFGVVNAVLIAYLGTEVVTQAVIAGLGVGTLGIYLLVYYYKHTSFPKYNLPHVVSTFVLLGTSILLFDEQNQVPNFYWLIHGAWHLLAYNGTWIAPAIMPRYPGWLNIGQSMAADPEGASWITMLQNHFSGVSSSSSGPLGKVGKLA